MASPGDTLSTLKLLREQSASWDAVQDDLLLVALQGIRAETLKRVGEVESRLERMVRRADGVDVRFRTTAAKLELLSQHQFVEHTIEGSETSDSGEEWRDDDESDAESETVHDLAEGRSEVEAIQFALDMGGRFADNPAPEQVWGVLPPIIATDLFGGVSDSFRPTDTLSPRSAHETDPSPSMAQLGESTASLGASLDNASLRANLLDDILGTDGGEEPPVAGPPGVLSEPGDSAREPVLDAQGALLAQIRDAGKRRSWAASPCFWAPTQDPGPRPKNTVPNPSTGATLFFWFAVVCSTLR